MALAVGRRRERACKIVISGRGYGCVKGIAAAGVGHGDGEWGNGEGKGQGELIWGVPGVDDLTIEKDSVSRAHPVT